MLIRLRRSRLLRLLLIAFLVPMIVMTTGRAAEASAWVTARTVVEFGNINGISAYGTVRCDISLKRLEDDNILQRGLCVGASDKSPGYAQPGEAGAFYQWRYVGDGCEGISGESVLRETDKDRVTRVAGVIEEWRSGGVSCTPTAVCIYHTDSLRSTKDFVTHEDGWVGSCASISIDPPSDDAECEHGFAVKPTIGAVRKGEPDSSNPKAVVRDVTVNHQLEEVASGWVMYVIRRKLTSASSPEGGSATHGITAEEVTYSYVAVSGSPPSPWNVGYAVHASLDNVNDPLPTPSRDIIGVGVFGRLTAGGLTQYLGIPEYASEVKRFGRHDPGLCSFYWGEKIWSDGDQGEGVDEPGAALGDPPPFEEPEEEVPDEDAWWLSLYDLLRELIGGVFGIVAAVASLPLKIASAIGALFIPSPGFMDGAVEGFQQQVEDSNAGEWNDLLTGIFTGSASARAGVPAEGGVSLSGTPTVGVTSSASSVDFGGGGCQGPALDMSIIIPEGMGSEFDVIHPFAACEGIAAEMAGWSRLLSGIFLALFGGFKILGLITSSAFGMKQTQIMSSHDWQSGRLDGRSL